MLFHGPALDLYVSAKDDNSIRCAFEVDCKFEFHGRPLEYGFCMKIWLFPGLYKV